MITEKTISPYIDDMIPRSIQKTEGIDQTNSPDDSKIIPSEGKDCPQSQGDHPKRKIVIPRLSQRCEGFNKEIQGVDSEGGFSRYFSKRLKKKEIGTFGQELTFSQMAKLQSGMAKNKPMRKRMTIIEIFEFFPNFWLTASIEFPLRIRLPAFLVPMEAHPMENH